MVGLVSDTDEGRYRKEVERLVDWCSDNNLKLNVSKTKEIIFNFVKSVTLQYSTFVDQWGAG